VDIELTGLVRFNRPRERREMLEDIGKRRNEAQRCELIGSGRNGGWAEEEI
jgi:hypothetical protein